MPSPTPPFRLLPELHERPWGVRTLAPWVDAAVEAPVGEAWFTAASSGTSLGPLLGDLLSASPAAMLGRAAFPGNQPLLFKLLFTADRLSVQVHPDDEYGWRHHQSPGKTEAWHVLAAEPAATVGLGFEHALSREVARASALSGEIEHLLAWLPARLGDTFLVPAGTVHAIGAGLTIAEVQEPSDVTYRLYDYGRPRELHLDHGFSVADLGPYRQDNQRTLIGPGRHLLAHCRYFTMERWEIRQRRPFSPVEDFYHLVVVLSGVGQVAGEPVRPGDVYFVPARTTAFAIESRSMDLLVAYTSPTRTRGVD